MIVKKFVCGPLSTNVYFIICNETKEGAVIDPATGALKHFSALSKDYDFRKIFLTHSHWDHIGDVSHIKKNLPSIEIWVHPQDCANLEKPGSDTLPVFGHFEGVKADHFFEDGKKLSLGKLECLVIHTPGHTPGSVCLYFEKEGIVFSGDTLFKGAIGNISFSNSNANHMWKSLKRLSSLPLETQVFPGHGNATMIEKEPWLSHAEEYFG